MAKPKDPAKNGPPLTGGGPSIVGVSGAMRARDVSRPRPQDDAAAEKRVVVRRAPKQPPSPPAERS